MPFPIEDLPSIYNFTTSVVTCTILIIQNHNVKINYHCKSMANKNIIICYTLKYQIIKTVQQTIKEECSMYCIMLKCIWFVEKITKNKMVFGQKVLSFYSRTPQKISRAIRNQ